MRDMNAAMARNALRILCLHFGHEPTYAEVSEMYIDIMQQVRAHRKAGGGHTVESLLLEIIATELIECSDLVYPDVEEP